MVLIFLSISALLVQCTFATRVGLHKSKQEDIVSGIPCVYFPSPCKTMKEATLGNR